MSERKRQVKWIQRKPKHNYDECDSILTKLACIRGIENIEEWLNPPSHVLHSPYKLANMDRAVERIVKAIYLEQKIAIMADIDADGIFSCAIMYNYLRQLTPNCSYIHSQRSNGHGVGTVLHKDNRREGLTKYLEEDTDLLIIVDSSSNSTTECKIIQEKMGIDCVIIDHHQIDDHNPFAIIVNCQMGEYPNKHLSGSAMCWKVCQVLDEYLDVDLAEDFLDLSAIGLISDMMNVNVLENRYIVQTGLQQIKNSGLLTLFHLINVDDPSELSASDIAYKISPVVNACSRYDKIELALQLFTSEDPEILTSCARELIHLNGQRKEEEKAIVERALLHVDNSHKVAVLVDDEIGSGFRGLIATQLVSKLDKPCFVLKYSQAHDKYSGSARTRGNVPLKSLVEVTSEFEYAQGHEGAFGLSIKRENLQNALTVLDSLLEGENKEEILMYDLELEASDITEELISEISIFSHITGVGVPNPTFRIKDVVVEKKEILGKQHKDTIKMATDTGLFLMKFKVDETYALDIEQALQDENRFMVELEVVGSLHLNSYFHWGKREWIKTNQVILDDYKIVE